MCKLLEIIRERHSVQNFKPQLQKLYSISYVSACAKTTICGKQFYLVKVLRTSNLKSTHKAAKEMCIRDRYKGLKSTRNADIAVLRANIM